MRRARFTPPPQVYQMVLIDETTCGRALELVAYLKGEIGALRVRVDAQRAHLREAEDCLFQVRGILAQARQEELFKDE